MAPALAALVACIIAVAAAEQVVADERAAVRRAPGAARAAAVADAEADASGDPAGARAAVADAAEREAMDVPAYSSAVAALAQQRAYATAAKETLARARAAVDASVAGARAREVYAAGRASVAALAAADASFMGFLSANAASLATSADSARGAASASRNGVDDAAASVVAAGVHASVAQGALSRWRSLLKDSLEAAQLAVDNRALAVVAAGFVRTRAVALAAAATPAPAEPRALVEAALADATARAETQGAAAAAALKVLEAAREAVATATEGAHGRELAAQASTAADERFRVESAVQAAAADRTAALAKEADAAHLRASGLLANARDANDAMQAACSTTVATRAVVAGQSLHDLTIDTGRSPTLAQAAADQAAQALALAALTMRRALAAAVPVAVEAALTLDRARHWAELRESYPRTEATVVPPGAAHKVAPGAADAVLAEVIALHAAVDALSAREAEAERLHAKAVLASEQSRLEEALRAQGEALEAATSQRDSVIGAAAIVLAAAEDALRLAEPPPPASDENMAPTSNAPYNPNGTQR